ncbi:NUDIX hydrolase [Caviibacter abscessus]|uniref:hypothetical protein n=1 Tax=Caviibacter abscessus TaxID=1766719 RepID=UPI0008309017|nr:hypothetical protein [Caviibacter abscessus]
MIKVNFIKQFNIENIDLLVVIPSYKNKWVIMKNKKSDTYEFPSIEIENEENLIDIASDVIEKQVGAKKYNLLKMGIFEIKYDEGYSKFGVLYYSIINDFINNFNDNIEVINKMPLKKYWTYPKIHPKLFELKCASDYDEI